MKAPDNRAATDQQTSAVEPNTLPELLNHIGDSVEVPQLQRASFITNPNNLKPLQQQRACDAEQVERVLAESAAAHQKGEWENTPADVRADKLDQIADELAKPAAIEAMAYADAITTGAIINVTQGMAKLASLSFRAAASYLREGHLDQTLPGALSEVEYFRRPWGPALLISPWNGPTAIGSHKVASALAAGAPCILKPSEWAPHSALIMADAIRTADLPRGTFGLTCGNRTIGATMVDDARISAISFTGGTAGGRAIARACTDQFKPTQLELGGNNPMIVFADADLDEAAHSIVYGLSNLNAQWCRALGRLIIHRSVKDELLQKIADRLSQLRLGDSLDPNSDMGPLIHKQQYESVLEAIDKLVSAGGSRLSTTALPDLPGYFVAPTMVDGCDPQDTVEEIFGPVAAVHSFDNADQALQLANGTPYGLAAYVFSRNVEFAREFARRIRTGGVKINGYNLLSLTPAAPRGAWGISGLGEEGTGQTIEFFTGARVVGLAPQSPIGGR
jgi:acyl-CoA reductase-like NAD-dependent aldehyde dehydrogenase